MDTGYALPGHDGPVLGGGVDAVGGNGPHIPHPVLVQQLDGGEPVIAGLAFLVLFPGLRDVHVHTQRVLPGEIRHPLPHRGAGGVFRVDGGIHQDLPIPGVVPVLIQADMVPTVLTFVRGEGLRAVEIHRAH